MDRRERDHQWFDRFDEQRMMVTLEGVDTGKEELEDVEIPVKYEVCGTCQGRGSHVNPSIDSNGLTASDFAEDPDFAESYFRGDYDQQCVECHGRRVAPVVDVDRVTKEQLELVEQREQALCERNAERAYAARYGGF